MRLANTRLWEVWSLGRWRIKAASMKSAPTISLFFLTDPKIYVYVRASSEEFAALHKSIFESDSRFWCWKIFECWVLGCIGGVLYLQNSRPKSACSWNLSCRRLLTRNVLSIGEHCTLDVRKLLIGGAKTWYLGEPYKIMWRKPVGCAEAVMLFILERKINTRHPQHTQWMNHNFVCGLVLLLREFCNSNWSYSEMWKRRKRKRKKNSKNFRHFYWSPLRDLEGFVPQQVGQRHADLREYLYHSKPTGHCTKYAY